MHSTNNSELLPLSYLLDANSRYQPPPPPPPPKKKKKYKHTHTRLLRTKPKPIKENETELSEEQQGRLDRNEEKKRRRKEGLWKWYPSAPANEDGKLMGTSVDGEWVWEEDSTSDDDLDASNGRKSAGTL